MSTQTISQEKTLYALDPSHSTVEFTVRHLMISKVRGRFAAFQGSLELAPGGEIPQAVNVSIDAKSVDTREEQRDNHLRSADFFDAERYPNLTFESTRIEGTAGDLRVTGNLTIHGVTKEVTLKAEFEGRAADPWGGQRVGYTAQTTVNRKDFGLTWNQALETGGVMVSDEVRIELNVQAVLQK
jgi:polyisoprenoid-binding protein YceI